LELTYGNIEKKNAISLFKSFPSLKKKPYWGNHFWSRGYCVSTIGMDEEKIRRYVKFQKKNERLEEDNEQEYSLF
jgi:putative transposase